MAVKQIEGNEAENIRDLRESGIDPVAVTNWDHETPAQRHQDAVKLEWEQYKRDKDSMTSYYFWHPDKEEQQEESKRVYGNGD